MNYGPKTIKPYQLKFAIVVIQMYLFTSSASDIGSEIERTILCNNSWTISIGHLSMAWTKDFVAGLSSNC